MIKFYLIVFLCIFLESSVVSYPLTLLSITILSIFRQDKVTILAFVAGLTLDLFLIRPLGVDSLYFLLLLYLGARYSKKIYEGAFIYRSAYLMVSFIFYSFLFYKTLNVVSLLITVIATSIILFWFEKFFPIKDKRRLAV